MAEIKKETSKEVIVENKEKKANTTIRRNARIERQAAMIAARQAAQIAREAAQIAQVVHVKTTYEVSNTTGYEVVLYWGTHGGEELYKFAYAPSYSTVQINCITSTHRIVGIPFLEVCENNSPDAQKQIHIPPDNVIPYKTVFDEKLKDYGETIIILDFVYNQVKKEIDQWKECALKSQFLIQQVLKIVGPLEKAHTNYDNIKALLDMAQDISIPESCTEMDKELAGIPSVLTNIT